MYYQRAEHDGDKTQSIRRVGQNRRVTNELHHAPELQEAVRPEEVSHADGLGDGKKLYWSHSQDIPDERA